MSHICEWDTVYHFPQDKGEFDRMFWDVNTAAEKWGVTYSTARRWMIKNPEQAFMVPVVSKRSTKPVYRLCVFLGTERTISPLGNPNFQDSEWQRENVQRRWPERGQGEPLPPDYHGNDKTVNLESRPQVISRATVASTQPYPSISAHKPAPAKSPHAWTHDIGASTVYGKKNRQRTHTEKPGEKYRQKNGYTSLCVPVDDK